MKRSEQQRQLRQYFQTLSRAWGPQHWWPARTRFEVVLGAYLTQNTAWTNVEKALRQLRQAKVLSLRGIRETPVSRLERLLRPAGYFRQKARSLKTFVKFLDQQHRGSLTRMLAGSTHRLRQQLLGLHGVGPETADSILLYAGNHPVFVVDAYTRRILDRHGILPADAPYETIRRLFETALATDPGIGNCGTETALHPFAHLPSPVSRASRSPLAQVYNEMHGLIVGVGKHLCRKKAPLCEQCPLRPYLPSPGA